MVMPCPAITIVQYEQKCRLHICMRMDTLHIHIHMLEVLLLWRKVVIQLLLMLSKLNITESISCLFARPGSLVSRQHEKRQKERRFEET